MEDNCLINLLPIEVNYIVCSYLSAVEVIEYYQFISQIYNDSESFFENVFRIRYKELYPGIKKYIKLKNGIMNGTLNDSFMPISIKWRDIYAISDWVNYDQALHRNYLNIIDNNNYYRIDDHFYYIGRDIIHGALLIINNEKNLEFVKRIEDFIQNEFAFDTYLYVYMLIYNPFIKNLPFIKSGKLENEVFMLEKVYHYTYFTDIVQLSVADRVMILILFKDDENLNMDGIESSSFMDLCKYHVKNYNYDGCKLIKKFVDYVDRIK